MAVTVLVLGDHTDPRMQLLVDNTPDTVELVFGEHPDDFGAALDSADAVLAWWRGRDALDPVLLAAPHLRWIHSSAAGLDHLMSPALVASDAVLTNSRGVYGEALGEYVIGAMLFFAKDMARLRDAQAKHLWDPFEGERLEGKVLSIVGYGDIGSEIAKRAAPFGIEVVAYRRRPELAENDPNVARIVDTLREAIEVADFLVLAAPLTAETERMIGAKQLAWMRHDGVLINIGRGKLVDQAALLDALRKGVLRGAALDVFETEPLDPDHALWGMSNVLLSPHCADRVEGWLDRTMQAFLANLERFVAGEQLLNVVDKQRGY